MRQTMGIVYMQVLREDRHFDCPPQKNYISDFDREARRLRGKNNLQ